MPPLTIAQIGRREKEALRQRDAVIQFLVLQKVKKSSRKP